MARNVLILVLGVYVLQTVVNSQTCIANNANDTLDWTDSAPSMKEFMKMSFYRVAGATDSSLPLFCCATGFDSVHWYFNGTLLNGDEKDVLTISEDGMRIDYLKPNAGKTNATCIINKEDDGQLKFEYELNIVKNCEAEIPTFTKTPEDICAEPGDDVIIECKLVYGDDDCLTPDSKKAVFVFANYTSDAHITALNDDPNIQVEVIPTDDRATSTLTRATFVNISEDYIGRDYACLPFNVFDKTRRMSITAGPCPDSEQSEGEVSADLDSDEDTQFDYIEIINRLSLYYKELLPDLQIPSSNQINSPQQLKEYFQRGSTFLRPLLIVLSQESVSNQQYEFAVDKAIESKMPLVFIKKGAGITAYLNRNPAVQAAMKVNMVLQYPDSGNKAELTEFYNFLSNLFLKPKQK